MSATGRVDLHALGELLASERRHKQLSQHGALARVKRRMGRSVGMATLGAWESGERLPEGGELVGYLCGLGTRAETVFAMAELLQPAPTGVEPWVSVERLRRLWERSPRDWEATVVPIAFEMLRCWAELAAVSERLGRVERVVGWVADDGSEGG